MSAPHTTLRGRLAPSPTGYLHLGNAWAFLWTWLACRAESGTLVLRIEDIDPQRSKPTYEAALLEDMRWLGLNWDEGPDFPTSSAYPNASTWTNAPPSPEVSNSPERGARGPYVQSRRQVLYAEALVRLRHQGIVYPCYCTRKELRDLAGAPHVDDTGAPYPGTCRTLNAEARASREAAGRRPCWRLDCTKISDDFVFTDRIQGPLHSSLNQCGGDFALCRSDGVFAYQLAVVVDDGLMGITQVVRGADILPSTPRQLALFDLLGFVRPSYAHIPLLCDAHGERLAKRHQSLTLRTLRENGVLPQAVVGYLAWKAGLIPVARPCAPQELLADFSLERLPREPVRLEANPQAILQQLRATMGHDRKVLYH